MKRYIPLVGVILFVLAFFCLSDYVWQQQKEQEKQEEYQAQQHMLVFSDMPDDVNANLAAAFYERTGIPVQVVSKTDTELSRKANGEVQQADVIIASEPVLRRKQEEQFLKPYVSSQTESVPYTFKQAEGYWNGLWLNPMVFVISYDYYVQRGMQLHTWDDLLQDPLMTVIFPDLASMDMAGDFLCSMVEVDGLEKTGLYLRALQPHIAAYSKSMASSVRRVASGEIQVGIVDAAMARQYRRDGAPIYILYPRDGTSYWLTGVAVTTACQDDERAGAFVEWLYSDEVDGILRKNHLYFTYASETARKILDSKGQELVLLPTQKNYTEVGLRELQDWWIKSIRFGKD